jgi:hypothetical protein
LPAYDTPTVVRPMPNLEHLKKQAKLFLRWHREGHFPVAAQIRLLPRFQHLNDHEILTARFKLADAQDLVARLAGWGSWPVLLKDLKTMSPSTGNMRAGSSTIVGAEPQLLVSNLAASLDFLYGQAWLPGCVHIRRAALLRSGGEG